MRSQNLVAAGKTDGIKTFHPLWNLVHLITGMRRINPSCPADARDFLVRQEHLQDSLKLFDVECFLGHVCIIVEGCLLMKCFLRNKANLIRI